MKKFKHGDSDAGNQVFRHVRSLFKRIFHWLIRQLGIRRFREHSFFAALLTRPATVADFGAHRGEFLAALKSEYSISKALLIEADPVLAEFLEQSLGDQTDVVHAAVIAESTGRSVTFTRSIEPEASSVFSEWSAACGIADQVQVPPLDFSEAIKRLGRRIDLIKLDVEGAEIGILGSASAFDLASCRQLTVEFHDNRPPFTRYDVNRVCEHMRSQGYGIVNANWPYVDDVVFVNLKSMPVPRRMEFRCRMALANALFMMRRVFFASGYS